MRWIGFALLLFVSAAGAQEVYRYEIAPGVCGYTAQLAMDGPCRIQLLADDREGTSATTSDRFHPVFLKVGGLEDTATTHTVKARFWPADDDTVSTVTELGSFQTKDVLTILFPADGPETLGQFRTIMMEVFDKYVSDAEVRQAMVREFVQRIIGFRLQKMQQESELRHAQELERMRQEQSSIGIIQ